MAAGVPILVVSGMLALVLGWSPIPTVSEVSHAARALYDYLEDYKDRHPRLAQHIVPEADQTQQLQQDLATVHIDMAETEDLLRETEAERDELRERLAGLETPSQFEVDQSMLDKLDDLERSRFLEAVQAYRVNAWTPTAAVCGLLLEGRRSSDSVATTTFHRAGCET